jgi:hypothetical protein
MADGTTKPISQVQPGDLVLATDPVTGVRSAQVVTAVWAHQDTLIALQVTQPADGLVSAGAGELMATVTTTADHPFWNHTDQQWQPATTLNPGDQLHTPNGIDRMPTVIGLLPHTQHQAAAYNLTITNPHTYHVLAGDTPVLVHNTCGLGSRLRNSSDGLKGIFDDGGVRGKSITDIRSQLLGNGFSQGLAKNKMGYLFQNATGEEVRIVRRGGGWDIRVRNASGNYLDEVGNVAGPADTHGIEVYSR